MDSIPASAVSVFGGRSDLFSVLEDRNKAKKLLKQVNKARDKFFKKHGLFGVRKKLLREMDDRNEAEEVFLPFTNVDGLIYQFEYPENKDYEVLYRLTDGKKELIIDFNKLVGKKDKAFEMGAVKVFGDIVVFGTNTTGANYYDTRIYNAASRTFFPEIIPHTADMYEFVKDGSGFVYVVLDTKKNREYKAMYHKLGTKVEEDVVLMDEIDTRFSLSISMSASQRYEVLKFFFRL